MRLKLAQQRGSTLVELAVALPFLVIVLVGAVDFARAFYVANELTNAARTGAHYASRAVATAANTKARAQAASPNISLALTDITVATQPYTCVCADSAGTTFTSTACTTPCSSGHMVTTVTVTATKTFTTTMNIPTVPHTVTLSRSAVMRLPN